MYTYIYIIKRNALGGVFGAACISAPFDSWIAVSVLESLSTRYPPGGGGMNAGKPGGRLNGGGEVGGLITGVA